MFNILIEVLADLANPIQCSAPCFKWFRMVGRAGEKQPPGMFYKKVIPKYQKYLDKVMGLPKTFHISHHDLLSQT